MSAPASKNARWTAAISSGASSRSRADHSASERSCPRASSAVAMPPSVTRTPVCKPIGGPVLVEGPALVEGPVLVEGSVLVDVHPVQPGQGLEGLLVALADRGLQV